MSVPREPKKAKLVVGFFMKDKKLLKPFAEKLYHALGPVDMVSPWIPFDFTSYYEMEMGAPLFRRILTFEKLIPQDQLVQIKLYTNELEMQYLEDGKRCINADPGILSHERFVLATGKNFTHRIYLKNGIFADLTLIFTQGRFQELPWTYPDYKDKNILSFLEKVRSKYLIDLKRN
ncbi:MAG: DUF4416 family protein [Desulfobacterales bacterium]|jgi:hypothetical protein|nr:DUF4416 family protein [Desulfobacterales bacterium]